MKKIFAITAAVFFTILILNTGAVQAATITFESGGKSTTATFTGAALVEGITVGPAGEQWTIDASLGETYPKIGTPNLPTMDLLSLDATSTSSNPLTITFSETGFSYAGDLLNAAGGSYLYATGSATATFNTYADGVLISNLGPFGPYSFNGNETVFTTITNELKLVATLTPASPVTVGFNFNVVPVAPVPEPASMLLLGSGLLGIGFFARRKKS